MNEIRNGHAANIQHRVERQETSQSDRQIPTQTTYLHLEIKQVKVLENLLSMHHSTFDCYFC